MVPFVSHVCPKLFEHVTKLSCCKSARKQVYRVAIANRFRYRNMFQHIRNILQHTSLLVLRDQIKCIVVNLSSTLFFMYGTMHKVTKQRNEC